MSDRGAEVVERSLKKFVVHFLCYFLIDLLQIANYLLIVI